MTAKVVRRSTRRRQNEVISAVWKASGGKAMVVPLRFEKEKGYCEMIFTWRPDPKKNVERELVVRGFVNAKRQMAVCTCFHTKGDTIKAELSPPGSSPACDAPRAPK